MKQQVDERYLENVLKRPKNYEFFVPIFIFIFFAVIANDNGIDIFLEKHFYLSQKMWMYRNNFILDKIFHNGGVILVKFILVSMCLYTGYLWKKKKEPQTMLYLEFVLVSCLMTILIVLFLKSETRLPCPWDCEVFGGSDQFLYFWQMFSNRFPKENCFPAGHSSAGYAFLSLYYGQNIILGPGEKKKLYFLFPGIFSGLLFGIVQQLRGAHFLSHDFATIIISIFSSWLTSWLFYFYYKLRG